MSRNIKKLRMEKGLTLLEVANALGVSEATMQRYESGAIKTIKYDTIEALCNILDATPAQLMGWDEIELTLKEQKFILEYRKLDNDHKQRLAEIIKFYIKEQE